MRLWRYGHAIEYLGADQRYRLLDSLGSGGMADVCLAWDEQKRRKVAIKIIKSDCFDQETLNRFAKEASLIERLSHPHILHVYSGLALEPLDDLRGTVVPYIVMEYAQQGNLQERLRPDAPYSLKDALHIFYQLVSAVQYAHDHGIIHRDLKPQNILFFKLLGGSEKVVLSDFGLAVEIGATHHTFAGAGTLGYMAPEQLWGHAEPASDIFALGVILYQLCTGVLPFNHSIQDLLRNILLPLEPPPRPSSLHAGLPGALDEIILTALAEEPGKRFKSASAFADAVREVLAPLGEGVDTYAVPASMAVGSADALCLDKSEDVRSFASNISFQRWFIGGMLLLLTALVVFAGIFYFSLVPGIVSSSHNFIPSSVVGLPNATTIIVPESKVISNNFVINAVTGTPNPAQRQVAARLLSVTTATRQLTVNATGTKDIPATQASGSLTFSSSVPSEVSIARGTPFVLSNGLQIVTDVQALIPPSGVITIAAHVVTPGAVGNLPAQIINEACCTTGVSVRNTAPFTGGSDVKSYTVVQQRDIDVAAQQLTKPLVEQAQAEIAAQIHSGEQLLSTPQCTPNTSSDHQVSDKTAKVTVVGSVICTGETYDQAMAQNLVKTLLVQTAQTNLGNGYMLSGSVQAQTTVQGTDHGSASLLAHAQGKWVYQISSSDEQELKRLIAGKRPNEALTLLKARKGIGNVTIQVNGSVLPADTSQISIVVQH